MDATLHKILKAKSSSNPEVELCISDALGVEPYELFPERYDEYQLPIPSSKTGA